MSKNIYFLVFKLAYVPRKVNLLHGEILLKATFSSLKVAFNELQRSLVER